MDVPSEKIWTINKSNLELALSKINIGADAEMDIRNAVNAGKVVTTHENRINFNGWIGEGYMVIDPNTGAGGYLISGGRNGYEGDTPEGDPSGVNMICCPCFGDDYAARRIGSCYSDIFWFS